MSKLIVERKNEFDLEIVLRGLQRSRQSDGTILLDEYLYAFEELCRYYNNCNEELHLCNRLA